MASAAAFALPAVLGLEGCARGKVPAATAAEPPLTHYRMPYGSVALQPGPALTRAYDELGLLVALQGIVNRDKPRLYLLGVTGEGGIDVDTFWWARMGELGWSVAKQKPYVASGMRDVLGRLGHRTRGLVVWDPLVPATANVAATLAGVLDLLPVAYRPGPGKSAPAWEQVANAGSTSLYSELVAAGWGAAVSLVNPDGSSLFTGRGTIPGTKLPSSGSAKNDAYLWAKVHYLDTGRCSTEDMGYYIDAWWLEHPSAGGDFWNNTLVNLDYYVARGAFIFDLDPWDNEAPVDDPGQKPGTDAATLKALFVSAYRRTGGKHMIDVGGFPPWAFKYTNFGSAGGHNGGVATEWRYAQTLSGYNAFMEADALGYSAIANASFTAHFPLKERYPQPAPPDAAALKAQGLLAADGGVVPARYFAFYVGDFDSPAWLYQTLPTLWTDAARGKVPLSWAFDPNLAKRAAPAMVWTRATASSEDTFVAGDSGAGYLNPSGLEVPRASGLPSGMGVWAAHCQRFYRQWDIRVTGFVIEGNDPAMGADGLKAYSTFSPGGTVGQKLPTQALIDGMPVLAMTSDIGGSAAQATAAVQNLFLPVSGAQFAVARAVLQRPSWYRQVAQALTQPSGGTPIRVLDLVTLMALLAQYERQQPQGAGTVSAQQAALSVVGGNVSVSGLRPLAAADSFWTTGSVGGRQAILFQSPPPGNQWSYLYLKVQDSGLLAGQPKTLWLEVRYHDAPAGLTLMCEYDSTNQSATLRGAYTPTATVTTTGQDIWKTVTWSLTGADLTGQQNSGADLRLDAIPGLAIDSVILTDQQPASG